MSRRTGYRTQYVHRRRRKKGSCAGWLAALVIVGVIGYIALAMGAGSWLHSALFVHDAEESIEENESSDVEQSPQPSQEAASEITETVAFPMLESFALCAGMYDSQEAAEQAAVLYRARGGAGYIVENEEKYLVLLAAYESSSACQSVAQNLRDEENIAATTYAIASDAVELKLTALPRRIDGIRDAFAIWQQTVQMLSDLWQDVDSGIATSNQALARLNDQRDKLKTTCETAFSDALIEGQSTALDGLYDVLQKTYEDLDAIVADPPQNVLEVSARIKYTGVRSLTEYQSYVRELKTELT